ncbi:cation:proton antiporter [Streptosporangium sp. CA-135522]|uniref:cation:proton antiporter n=1 Tax=Streptosporangium sp. CA-135522 TaxID=3240072 RepID=UPI003D8D565C
MKSEIVVQLLLGLALIFVVCQLLGALARRFDMPAVIGEIVAGILVGPTLFQGWIADTLFPSDVRPMLGALANLGVALFMFLVGLELDRGSGVAQGRAVVGISAGSVLLPFGLGVLVALWLSGGHQGGTGFVLFIGTAMAVTAFPVLARIIEDRGMGQSRVGGLALASAAVGDVIAWTLLAVIVASYGSGGHAWQLLWALPYLVLMFTVVPRLTGVLWARVTGSVRLAVAVVGVLISGGATEWMGLHFVFGAFLFGLVMPRPEGLRADLRSRVAPLATMLLPVYFVIAGFNVDLSQLTGSNLLELGLILVAAMGGKLVGVYAAARFSHLDPRSAFALATLMNTRGLTEIVLLTVGLQMGIVDDRMYSLMVAMAVITTVLCGPLLKLAYPSGWSAGKVAEPVAR